MTAAITTEEFYVTLLTDTDLDISWKIIAETPEQALEKAMRLPEARACELVRCHHRVIAAVESVANC